MRYVLGIILIMIGVALRYWAIRTLGSDFTEVICMPSRKVTTGPYRFMKHPSYVGSLCIVAGGACIADIVGILLIAWAFYRSRMVIENEILKRY